MWKVPLFDLDYGKSELEAVTKVIESKWLTSGPNVKKFEEQFGDYLGEGVKCCALSSGTASLHLALLLCNLEPGDEVILSGLSFVAPLNVVKLVGATPVLADSKSLEDWNVSPSDIKSKVSDKTKAIIVVHYAGYPCDMDEIKKISKDNGLVLIEDVAHAVGGEYKGRKCGTLGDIACFSFFSNKNLSTGEGGMLVVNNSDFYDRANLLRSHGMTSLTIDRYENKAFSYDVIEPGLNYRFDEIRAALGIEQLKKLDANNEKRRELVRVYQEKLSGSVEVPWTNEDAIKDSSCHIFPVLLPEGSNRVEVADSLAASGIQTSLHYPSYGGFSFYKKFFNEGLSVADEISNRVLTLPLYPTMTVEDVESVAVNIKASL